MRGQRFHGRVLLHGSLVAASVAALVQCGESEPDSTFVGRDPCQNVYAGQCGSSCQRDDNCPAGLHCGAQGQCTAQCGGSDTLCKGGVGCSSRGRCLTGNGGNGGTGIIVPPDGSAGISGDGGVCADIALKVAPTTPTIVLVIDQSDSMDDGFPNDGDPARWTVLRNSLMDPTNGVIKRLEAQVRFGMVLYGNATPFSAPQCPDLTRIMPPRLNAHAGINAVYGPADTIPNTPTAESITAVTTDLEAFTEPGPKFIILATDGDPDRCGAQDAHDDTSKQMSVDAVRAAWAKQIGTYVIAVGDDATESHLNDLAHWGRGINPASSTATHFFQPASQTALVNDLLGIINGVRSCDFTLNGKVDAAQAQRGAVTLDGTAVPFGAPNGWTVDATGARLTLNGTSCNTIKQGNHDLRATFPCGVVIEPPPD
ncbi:MAG TPA: vWA domain-containing protein [Polyangiaceae bacterium]|nr:vWA domain-containing protein [Polyangiaceae bacterium]